MTHGVCGTNSVPHLETSSNAAPTPHPEVFAAVAALSPRQRAVVYLTYWEDLDPGAAAALIGISDGAVRRHLARARKTLRGVLHD